MSDSATEEACLVFLQRLETARQGSCVSDLTLLLGETLEGLADREDSDVVKGRYLDRAREAYLDVVRNEPRRASGYLGLAELAPTGEARVEWLRGAVQAEHKPAHRRYLPPKPPLRPAIDGCSPKPC